MNQSKARFYNLSDGYELDGAFHATDEEEFSDCVDYLKSFKHMGDADFVRQQLEDIRSAMS